MLAKQKLENRSIHLKVVVEDACIPSQGVPAAKKLLHIDKIAALVGSYCIASMVPNADSFERKKVFAFQSSVVPNSLRKRKHIVSTFPAIETEGKLLAEYAYQNLGARRVGMLYLQTPWGESFRESFSKRFSELGGEIVSEQGNPIGVNEFRSELTKINASQPDLLFFVHVGTTMGTALKQARRLGMIQEVLGPDEAAEEIVLETAGEAAENLILLSPEPLEKNESARVFNDAYAARYGKKPSVLAAHSYDSTLITGLALDTCGVDANCISKYVHEIDNYEGASGTFSIGADGTTTREFIIKHVKGGVFTRTKLAS